MHIQSTFRAQTAAEQGLPAAGLAELRGTKAASAATFYPADAAIYVQGDAAGALYLVEFGTVRVCRVTADGRRQISAFHLAGEVFGFEAGDEHESYAESVDGAGIRVLCTEPSQLPSNRLLQLALKNLNRAQDHLLVLGRRTANERMAALLVDLMKRRGNDRIVRLPMQRSDVADYLGITFETVSRILRFLKDQGIVVLNSVNEIEILDRTALEQMCD